MKQRFHVAEMIWPLHCEHYRALPTLTRCAV